VLHSRLADSRSTSVYKLWISSIRQAILATLQQVSSQTDHPSLFASDLKLITALRCGAVPAAAAEYQLQVIRIISGPSAVALVSLPAAAAAAAAA